MSNITIREIIRSDNVGKIVYSLDGKMNIEYFYANQDEKQVLNNLIEKYKSPVKKKDNSISIKKEEKIIPKQEETANTDPVNIENNTVNTADSPAVSKKIASVKGNK